MYSRRDIAWSSECPLSHRSQESNIFSSYFYIYIKEDVRDVKRAQSLTSFRFSIVWFESKASDPQVTVSETLSQSLRCFNTHLKSLRSADGHLCFQFMFSRAEAVPQIFKDGHSGDEQTGNTGQYEDDAIDPVRVCQPFKGWKIHLEN